MLFELHMSAKQQFNEYSVTRHAEVHIQSETWWNKWSFVLQSSPV